MAFDESLRIGAGNVMMDAVGGDFSSPTDLGKTSEDGIALRYSADIRKVRSAQEITVEEVFLIAEELQLEFMLKEHTLENIALSFGHNTSDVVDDSVSTPKTKTLTFGARRSLPKMAFQISIPQPVDDTLDDIITIFNGLLIPSFDQVLKVQEERYIKVVVEALGRTSDGTLGSFVSEYSTS